MHRVPLGVDEGNIVVVDFELVLPLEDVGTFDVLPSVDEELIASFNVFTVAL